MHGTNTSDTVCDESQCGAYMDGKASERQARASEWPWIMRKTPL